MSKNLGDPSVSARPERFQERSGVSVGDVVTGAASAIPFVGSIIAADLRRKVKKLLEENENLRKKTKKLEEENLRKQNKKLLEENADWEIRNLRVIPPGKFLPRCK
jgi:alanyl-tRNA synthetase